MLDLTGFGAAIVVGHNVFHIVQGTSRACCHKGWPFRQERLAASTGMAGTTGKISCETVSRFLGTGMVPKSQVRQTLAFGLMLVRCLLTTSTL